MAYTFKYQLQKAPTASTDGTGAVCLLINALSSTNGVNYALIQGYSKSIYLHHSLIKKVLDMPHATPQEKTLKNTAFKELLRIYAEDTFRTKVPNWTIPEMTKWATNNDNAALEAERANTYLTTTLGMTYPIDFAL